MSEISRVSFQNKFEKLVNLVGFIIRICHDVRSHESKIPRKMLGTLRYTAIYGMV